MEALPKRTSNSWSVARGYHLGYHCFINAAILRDVSLFEGSIQIPEKRTNLTVSTHRQTNLYHQRNGDLSLSRQIYCIS